jgi:hypothetical protein
MTVSFDEYFEWMKRRWDPKELYICQDIYPYTDPDTNSFTLRRLLEIPERISQSPYKGLELLEGKGLVVGFSSRRFGNAKGQFFGANFRSINDMLLSVQVFEPVKGIDLVDGLCLPLVARVDYGSHRASSVDYHLLIEYCAFSPKYLGFEAKPSEKAEIKKLFNVDI